MKRSRVPYRHRVTPEESMVLVRREFGIQILEKQKERTYLF